MNFSRKIRIGFAAIILAVGFANDTAVATEDTLVALGYVTRHAPRHRVVNATDGFLNITEGSHGQYYINIESSGEFTTASPNDFVIEVGNNYTGSNDKIAVAHVSYLDPNRLTVAVSLSDSEDTIDPHLAASSSHDFYFVIRRLPGNGIGSTTGSPHAGYNPGHTVPRPPRRPSDDRISGDTKYLTAFGKINSDGSLASGFGVNGLEITTSRNTLGEYELILQQNGSFATDTSADYLIFVTPMVQGTNDVIGTGTCSDTSSDNEAVFLFHTDDAQNGNSTDFPTGKDIDFCFQIYRMDPSLSEQPARSRLIKAIATFHSNGALTSGATAYKNGTIQVVHEAYGAFKVVVQAPGEFAGRYANEFIVGASLNQDATSDHEPNALVNIIDANTLEVEIFVNDLEYGDETNGVAANSPVYFLLFDSQPETRPDMKIGNKKRAAKMRGNDVYNQTGAGQTAKLKSKGKRKTGKLFLEVENDGDIADNIRLIEQGSGSAFKVKLFQLTGGRKNITAQVKGYGIIAGDLLPGRRIQIEARISARKKSKSKRAKVKFTGMSSSSPGAADTARAKLR